MIPRLINSKKLVSQSSHWLLWLGISPGGSFVYLAVILDLYTRKIVGWRLLEHMKATLVVEALTEILISAKVPANSIFHSDKGIQYSSEEFRRLLQKKEILQSMSARGNSL